MMSLHFFEIHIQITRPTITERRASRADMIEKHTRTLIMHDTEQTPHTFFFRGGKFGI